MFLPLCSLPPPTFTLQQIFCVGYLSSCVSLNITHVVNSLLKVDGSFLMSPRQPWQCKRFPLPASSQTLLPRWVFPPCPAEAARVLIPQQALLTSSSCRWFVLGGRTDVVPLPPVFPVQWGKIWGLGCFRVHPVRRESAWVVPLCPCQSSDGLASSRLVVLPALLIAAQLHAAQRPWIPNR